MRAYNGFTPRSLLGGGFSVITSYVAFTGSGVGPLVFSFGSSASATKVHSSLTVALTAAWPGPQTW